MLRHVLLVLLIVLPAIGTGFTTAGVAQQASVEITGLDAPSSAAEGDRVTVSATAVGRDDLDTALVLRVFRMDTKELLCEARIPLPGDGTCTGVFTMPADDVELRATLSFAQGGIPDDAYTTVTLDSSSSGERDTTTSDQVTDIEGGEIVDEPTTTPSPEIPETPTEPEPESGSLVDAVTQGLTDFFTGNTDLVQTTLRGIFISPFRTMTQHLVANMVLLLTYTPDVNTSPAVKDVHRLALAISVGLALVAVMFAGLLHMVGPVFGIQYRQVRMILPRLLVAVVFGALSLPLLQLSVDLANAVTVAFKPTDLQMGLQGILGTGVAIILAIIINAVLLLAVVAVYLLRDVYLLFLAAASPLIAVAWAFPYSRRYAAAFIGGWWTALSMGPLAMLVLRFVFVLLDGGGPLGQAVANWLFGVAGFLLLLLVPYQVYGASQMLTLQAFSTVRGVQRGVRRQYRRSRQEDDLTRRAAMQNAVRQPDAAEGTGEQPDWWYLGDDWDDDEGGAYR